MARKNEAQIVLTAKDRTKSVFRSVTGGLSRMASVGLAGAAAGTVLLTRAALRQIDALAKQSQLLGITTQKLAALQLVTAKTGVEQKTLEKSLINVTRVVAEAAEGTGLAVDTLKKLGLEAKDLSKQSPDEMFKQIAVAMGGLNTQSEKVLASYELFGGRGAALLRTLEAGAAGFEEAEEKVKRFGTAIAAVDAKSIEVANDAFTDTQEALKGVGFDLARRFAPGMEAASNATTGFLVTIRRDFIPALAMMLEKLELVQSNVRGLSDIELQMRVELQGEILKDLGPELLEATKRANVARERMTKMHDSESSEGVYARMRLRNETLLLLEKEAAQARLDEVQGEITRRAQFEIDAQQKLDDQKEAQAEETRQGIAEKEREHDRKRFDERTEDQARETTEYIAERLRRAEATRRIALTEARAEQRALITRGRMEERAAIQTVRLRQMTAAMSIQILQTLVGKNRRVAQALFLVEKGLAIARTVQNTAAASVKALAELGPIAGPPAAAAINAYGAAQVGLIAATALTGVSGVGGGGLGGIGGGGSIGGGEREFSDPAEAPDGGGGGLPQQGVTQMIFPNLIGITPEAIDALADALREASENRDIIIVSGTGRNAELLQGANG